MPAPSVVRAEIRCEQPGGFGNRPRTFTADITAMAQGFVIKRMPGLPETKSVPARKALPSTGPITIEQGSGALVASGAPTRQEMVEETRHILQLTITTACFVDDGAGFYMVPHDHLKIVTGAEGLRALNIPMAGEALNEQEIVAGLTRYRDRLQKQVDDLNRQLGGFKSVRMERYLERLDS
jgi:hypothetical protein